MSLRELGAEPGNHKQIEEILAATVADMIEECLEEHKRAPADDLTHPLGPGDEAGGDTPEKLPLIRLRVDYTGYSTIHAQRFGHRFVGKVANPTDILLFSKTAERCAARSALPSAPFACFGAVLAADASRSCAADRHDPQMPRITGKVRGCWRAARRRTARARRPWA